MFEPGEPIPETYEGQEKALLVNRVLSQFQQVLGIPRGAVLQDFRELIEDCINSRFPELNCSAARAIVEKKLPNIPDVFYSNSAFRVRLERALLFLDVMETIVREAYVQSELASEEEADQPA